MADTHHPKKEQGADSRGIPADCIRLNVVFRDFVRALYPESGGIENMHAAPLANRPASTDNADSREFSDVVCAADFEFRNRIASEDGPQAYVRDPKNGERLQLAKEEWIIPAGRLYLALGFPDDFVWHDASDPLSDPGISYGPADTLVDGYLRPVFFLRADSEKLIADITAAPVLAYMAAAPGRPSIMKTIIEPELDRWIAGGKAVIVEKLKTYGQDRRSVAAIARALAEWAKIENSNVPVPDRIETALRKKLREAYKLL